MLLHQGDALCWLRSLSDRSVDLVVTDPPYDSMEKHRASSGSPGSTCRELGMDFIGSDAASGAHAYLAERIRKADAQQELFG